MVSIPSHGEEQGLHPWDRGYPINKDFLLELTHLMLQAGFLMQINTFNTKTCSYTPKTASLKAKFPFCVLTLVLRTQIAGLVKTAKEGTKNIPNIPIPSSRKTGGSALQEELLTVFIRETSNQATSGICKKPFCLVEQESCCWFSFECWGSSVFLRIKISHSS